MVIALVPVVLVFLIIFIINPFRFNSGRDYFFTAIISGHIWTHPRKNGHDRTRFPGIIPYAFTEEITP